METSPIVDKEAMKMRMFTDISYFAQMIFPEVCTDKTPEFHREIYGLLQREDLDKVAIIAPRGHAKTTLSSKIYPLYRILFQTLKYIVIISESQGQSVDLLRSIKDEIDYNPRIKYFFGDVSGQSVGNKWAEGDIVTATGIRVFARGSRQRIRGTNFNSQRPELVILDDFESELNTETPEQRDKLKKWINGAVLPSVDPKKGRVFLIGTIVHEDAYLNDINNDEHGNLGWYKKFYQAIKPDGTALWHERYSIEKLEAIKSQYAYQGMEYMFFQEYQNMPVAPDAGLIKSGWIKDRDSYELREQNKMWFIKKKEDDRWRNLATFLGIDPSLGKRGGDYSGLVVLGVDDEGTIYVLEAVGITVNPMQLIDIVFEKHEKWHFTTLALETVLFQEVLRDLLFKEQIERQAYFGIKDFNPREKKGLRLQALVPFYAQGRVIHTEPFPEFKIELLNYPKAKHDDILDAMRYALDVIYTPNSVPYVDNIKVRIKRKVREKLPPWSVL